MTDIGAIFKPGQVIPVSGIYRVIHDPLSQSSFILPSWTLISGRPSPPTGLLTPAYFSVHPRSWTGNSRRTNSIAASRDVSRPSSWASSTAVSTSLKRGLGS